MHILQVPQNDFHTTAVIVASSIAYTRLWIEFQATNMIKQTQHKVISKSKCKILNMSTEILQQL